MARNRKQRRQQHGSAWHWKQKKAAYNALRSDPEFQRLTKQRADAYYAGQNYLLTSDEELKRLNTLVK